MSIPVVFYHDNNQEYLKWAIKSAKDFNERVILLGTQKNKDFSEEWYDTDLFDMSDYYNFEKKYVHMSSNSKKFEITAFKKYFMLQQYLKLSGEKNCVLLDSDILTYQDFSSLKEFQDVIASVSEPPSQSDLSWTASGHTFYCTKEALDDFIDFFINTYTNNIVLLQQKYDWHRYNGLKGGICDMTLLYLWKQNRQDILNLLELEKYIIDHSLQTTSHSIKKQFKRDAILRLKKVKYIDGIPYFYDLAKKDWVKAGTLHFQGSAKALMGDYYNNNSYIIKVYHRYYEFLLRVLKCKGNKNKT